ncbi:MAG TPA: hypothetical protein VN577_07285 [Terriglobales bacterium]|nr:hypothetical protein [Terriglobales bacterium]
MSYRFCEHIKDNNEPCGSPALRGRHFCYYHSRLRTVSRHEGKPRIRVGAIESRQSIEILAAQLCQAVLDDEITPTKANTILRALKLVESAMKKFQTLHTREVEVPASMQEFVEQVDSSIVESEPECSSPEAAEQYSPQECGTDIPACSPPGTLEHTARSLPPHLRSNIKRILRQGPSHPQFRQVSRMLDAQIASLAAG